MGFPLGAAELIGDQAVGGLGVGHAQQGFGKTHQSNAFRRRQFVFLQEIVDAAEAPARCAHALDKPLGARADGVAVALLERDLSHQRFDTRGLIAAQSPANLVPQSVFGA